MDRGGRSCVGSLVCCLPRDDGGLPPTSFQHTMHSPTALVCNTRAPLTCALFRLITLSHSDAFFGPGTHDAGARQAEEL